MAARLPYPIAGIDGAPLQVIDGPVRFTVMKIGRQFRDPVKVRPRIDGVPRAYLPLEFTFAEPGYYDVGAYYQEADLDGSLQVDRAAVTTPMVGDTVPPVATPTTNDTLGVDPLCSRPSPCPDHSISLGTALTSGRPTVLLISAPAYCQTAICGPILEMVIDDLGESAGVNVIHSEVTGTRPRSPTTASRACSSAGGLRPRA